MGLVARSVISEAMRSKDADHGGSTGDEKGIRGRVWTMRVEKIQSQKQE